MTVLQVTTIARSPEALAGEVHSRSVGPDDVTSVQTDTPNVTVQDAAKLDPVITSLVPPLVDRPELGETVVIAGIPA